MSGRSGDFDDAVVGAVKRLMPQARSLTKSISDAEDLVSETVLRAIEKHEQFQAGTNLLAWLSVIMRNAFFTRCRRKGREVEDPDGVIALTSAVSENQTWSCDLHTFERYARLLPAGTRDAFYAIVVEQLSYEEAATELNVAIGTIKSRVNRAKEFLESFTDTDDSDRANGVADPATGKTERPVAAVISAYKSGCSLNEICNLHPDLSRLEVMEIISGAKR